MTSSWSIDKYPNVGPAGAAKLISSAVAPLVAYARGVMSVNLDNVASTGKIYSLPDRKSSQGRRFRDAIEVGDVLLMPWIGLSNLVTAASSARPPVPTAIQYRPDHAPVDADGREIKYEFVRGDRTPVDAHPATPVGWLSDSNPVIVAEGQLKADAALTAMLRAGGAGVEDLLVRDDESQADAKARLRGMLEALPNPYLILGIAGVHNWRHNSGDWQWVTLSGRDVMLGMDGDVATNPAVHSSTSALWAILAKAGANPALLSPTVPGAAEDKLGIDDYLAEHGDWASLLAMATPTMPDSPVDESADQVGTYRISADGNRLEFCYPLKDQSTGVILRGDWRPAGVELGGRIVTFIVDRAPTRTEAETGVFEPGAAMGDATVEIEVGWTDTNERRCIITGPADILNHPPDRWADKGGSIPYPLLAHPHWPPRGPEALGWVQAVKEFQVSERSEVTRWTRMGWVPQPGNRLPAFVIGDQVVGDEDSARLVNSAVTDDTLNECSTFGVDDIDPRPFNDPGYLAELAADWEWLLRTHLQSGAWTDQRVGSLVVAAGLRPCLPLRTNSSLYASGPPGGGKSWTAAAIAAFWSRAPGAWSNKHLPGSAKDSAAATGASLAQAVLWVLDDLAPGTSRSKAEAERAMIDDSIRSVHNGKGAGRARPDGSVRRGKDPISLLVVTAENPPDNPSVRQRTIVVDFRAGSLSNSRVPTNEIEAGYTQFNVPARITQGFLKFLRFHAAEHPEGWSRLVQEVLVHKAAAEMEAVEHLQERNSGGRGGNETRAAQIASDLMVVVPFVAMMMAHLRPYLAEEQLELFVRRDAGVSTDIAELVADGWEQTLASTPGRNLLRAISACLRAGKAHVTSGEDPKREPGRTPQESIALGWQVSGDQPRPIGDPIGCVLAGRGGLPYVLLDPQVAFRIAYQTFPRIIGEGQGPASSWQAFYDDELFYSEADGGPKREGAAAVRPQPGRKGSKHELSRLQNRSRVTVGTTRRYGVPVLLDTLLEADDI